MRFGIFYEHQLPRPWEDGAELRLFQEALDQVELADRVGIDYAWEVEHHFLEEYSHSSAPEVFLAAASQRSKRIRLGHGIVLMPPAYNPPAGVAERLATLDLVSGGRVDWGTGESASRAELEGFGIDPNERRAMWRETVEQVANMMVMDPYPGFSGKYFSMPVRNVLPKPVQKPHPPIWVACSNRETIHLAAQLGIGALTFAFIDPSEARHWVADYYETFKRECVPIGHAVNPNIAMVTGFSCHADAAEARGARAGHRGRVRPQASAAVTGRRPDPDVSGLRHHRRADGRRHCQAAGGEPPPRRDVSTDRPDREAGLRRRSESRSDAEGGRHGRSRPRSHRSRSLRRVERPRRGRLPQAAGHQDRLGIRRVPGALRRARGRAPVLQAVRRGVSRPPPRHRADPGRRGQPRPRPLALDRNAPRAPGRCPGDGTKGDQSRVYGRGSQAGTSDARVGLLRQRAHAPSARAAAGGVSDHTDDVP